MKCIGVIPARYESSRFPGKPIVLIAGKALIIHVAEKVEAALGKENTYVATDDNRIKELVESHGYQVVMTHSNHLTGTDRLWEVAQKIPADVYVNVQGDEPMVDPNDILKILNIKKENPGCVVNGMGNLLADEDPANVNIPKVLVNKHNDLIYMSRLAVPGIKSEKTGTPQYKKQICIYAFNRHELEAFGNCTQKAEYEKFEDIEILRFFDLGIPIKMVELQKASLAVDIPEDVAKVEAALSVN
ncbi:MAG: 3-deoxy-manno-octulosonate cytidylyltransferase [Flavobacteriales bacterium]|nr:3-deoxy-manno-octulosonate cytidylyltransferase [Flavobacteriales bacterium]